MAVFDQRGQQVGSQINIRSKGTFDQRQQTVGLAADLETARALYGGKKVIVNGVNALGKPFTTEMTVAEVQKAVCEPWYGEIIDGVWPERREPYLYALQPDDKARPPLCIYPWYSVEVVE